MKVAGGRRRNLSTHRTGILAGLVSSCVGSLALVVACSGDPYTGPVLGAGCSSEQQESVTLEGETRVAEVFVTRDYVTVEIYGGNTVREQRHRSCQAHRCSVSRQSSDGPLTDAEVSAALQVCRVEADAAWKAEHPD